MDLATCQMNVSKSFFGAFALAVLEPVHAIKYLERISHHHAAGDLHVTTSQTIVVPVGLRKRVFHEAGATGGGGGGGSLLKRPKLPSKTVSQPVVRATSEVAVATHDVDPPISANQKKIDHLTAILSFKPLHDPARPPIVDSEVSLLAQCGGQAPEYVVGFAAQHVLDNTYWAFRVRKHNHTILFF